MFPLTVAHPQLYVVESNCPVPPCFIPCTFKHQFTSVCCFSGTSPWPHPPTFHPYWHLFLPFFLTIFLYWLIVNIFWFDVLVFSMFVSEVVKSWLITTTHREINTAVCVGCCNSPAGPRLSLLLPSVHLPCSNTCLKLPSSSWRPGV